MSNKINKLISANNKFAFQLFSEIQKSQSNENIFISPSSIAIALSMTYNGAAGKTQEAMAKTLNFEGMSLEEINQANQDLGILLNSLNPEIKLNIANSIWTRKGISFDPSFLQVNQDFYQSQVREIDFDDPESPKIINNWVKDKTEGKIDKVIQEFKLNSVMLLLNAIYFKADWQEAFSEDSTKEMPFYLANRTQKQHPIMFKSSDYLYYYYENENFQAVSLPYKKGVSMYIFLPSKQVGLEGFYQVLNEENWEDWMKQFRGGYEVNLGLPKFKNEYEVSLNDVLKSLGMEIAFDDKKADFSQINSEQLYISEVKHKTFVEVNETGTEAAAVTSVKVSKMSLKIPVNMLINRPFFLAITENDSGTILFMGAITNPEN